VDYVLGVLNTDHPRFDFWGAEFPAIAKSGHWRYPCSGEWSNHPNRASACFEGTNLADVDFLVPKPPICLEELREKFHRSISDISG
jgi:hypothetical protein